jgi:hypothetical protein
MNNKIKEYEDYLTEEGISVKSIPQYLAIANKFRKSHPNKPNLEIVNSFLNELTFSNHSYFLKNKSMLAKYLEFKKEFELALILKKVRK